MSNPLKTWFKSIQARFGWIEEYLTPAFRELSSDLQRETAKTITSIAEGFIRPTLVEYLMKYGQKGFDRIVEEDKFLYPLAEKYRPSSLRYARQAKKVKKYFKWDSERLSSDIVALCREQGLVVNYSGEAYVKRELERWRVKIFGD